MALNAKGVKIIDLLGKPHFKSVFGGLSEKKKQSDKREDRSFELKESTFSNISVKSRSGLHSAPFHRLP